LDSTTETGGARRGTASSSSSSGGALSASASSSSAPPLAFWLFHDFDANKTEKISQSAFFYGCIWLLRSSWPPSALILHYGHIPNS